MNPLIPRLFSSVFVLVGVILLTPGLRNLSRARVSVTWPQAPGVVIFTKMTSSTSVTRDADGIKSRRTSYNSPLVVEYEVNGTKHYTNKRCFGQLAGADAEWAHKIAKHYPVGSKIPVAYSPTDPDFAVVEPGLSTEAYWLPGAGAAFFLFGLAVLLVFRF